MTTTLYTETFGPWTYFGDVEDRSANQFTVNVLADLQDPHASYSFDTILLFEYEGKLHYERDSGCSCPSPFEDVTVAGLKPFSYTLLDMEVNDWADSHWYDEDEKAAYTALSVPFMAKAAQIAKEFGVLYNEDGSFT